MQMVTQLLVQVAVVSPHDGKGIMAPTTMHVLEALPVVYTYFATDILGNLPKTVPELQTKLLVYGRDRMFPNVIDGLAKKPKL